MARIFISIGTNIDREHYLNQAFHGLNQAFQGLKFSQVYESEAVGFEGENFYNLVVEAQSDASVEQVVSILKQIEDKNGRVRGGEKFSARTLDLDLLLYDDVVCQEPISLPRDEVLTNAFVLLPLQELAPSLEHPQVGQTMEELWQAYEKSKQSLWPIEFLWPQSA
ncbi:2-amino-4-hydroxy-6-hydroxymethyldihydropteridine diphosphokinase [Algicola sagamiensis]|uniref:2-amino-4-hydroxy-6- hydroxymethyldihydropteridine diphosphokinase n=1 Tax=Algicola sagamiensis TaxID=163869 RepID=UPI0003688B63|nr:2-amino-4-hydroxy-6-hydroxymethyldihydropteridine diphosphokinase [Algicola sagamiensis]